jgi:branched-chain amino acid transport system ATP-binding protein
MSISAASEAALTLRNVSVSNGKSSILTNIDLDVRQGEAIALLGANGAGKTTLLNTISGILRPDTGTIAVHGKEVHGRPPHSIFSMGVVQVSQSRDLFLQMSVFDNLKLGAVRKPHGAKEKLERIYSYFPRLAERKDQLAATLSGGEQQMLAMGRALMSEPKILLLDEPSGGLAPKFVDEIANIVSILRREHATMLIVEQNIALALGVADRLYVLRSGRIMLSAVVDELDQDHRELAKKYYL